MPQEGASKNKMHALVFERYEGFIQHRKQGMTFQAGGTTYAEVWKQGTPWCVQGTIKNHFLETTPKQLICHESLNRIFMPFCQIQ